MECRMNTIAIIGSGLLALTLTASLGNNVIDLYQHPSFCNGSVLAAAIIFGTGAVLWRAENSPANPRKPQPMPPDGSRSKCLLPTRIFSCLKMAG